jgi:hypothetical protein
MIRPIAMSLHLPLPRIAGRRDFQNITSHQNGKLLLFGTITAAKRNSVRVVVAFTNPMPPKAGPILESFVTKFTCKPPVFVLEKKC